MMRGAGDPMRTGTIRVERTGHGAERICICGVSTMTGSAGTSGAGTTLTTSLANLPLSLNSAGSTTMLTLNLLAAHTMVTAGTPT